MFSPKFTITNKILQNISAIEAAREVVDYLVIAPEWESKFKEDALIRACFHGTHLENNGLTINQIDKIVKEDPGRDEKAELVAKKVEIVASEKDIQEVINYRNVLRFIDQLTRLTKKAGVENIGEKEFLQIHSLMMEKILASHLLGIYRTGSAATENEKAGRVPLPVEVPYQMDDFWYWLKRANGTEIHPVIAAGIAHYELTRIQPFSAGNGKVTRLFSQLLLGINGYNNKLWNCFDEYFNENKQIYFNNLSEASEKRGELTVWIEFITGAYADELVKIKERARRLSLEGGVKIKQSGRQVALTERQIALMEFLEMNEEMSMMEARRVLPMVSDDTILRDLTALVRKKLVRKKGKTKGARYSLISKKI